VKDRAAQNILNHYYGSDSRTIVRFAPQERRTHHSWSRQKHASEQLYGALRLRAIFGFSAESAEIADWMVDDAV
jgi:hypothetical protein